MERLPAAIHITSIIVAFYCIGLLFEFPYMLLFITSFILPILTIWMVIRILIDPNQPDMKFEDQFYQDSKIMRSKGGHSSD